MSKLKVTTIANATDTESVNVTNVVNGSAKAWVNFNGTGTVAIRASHNVSSISDIGTGDYVVNFETAFSDTNYAAIGCWSTTDNSWNGAYNSAVVIGGNIADSYTARYSTTQVGIANYAGGTPTDIEQVNVVVFR